MNASSDNSGLILDAMRKTKVELYLSEEAASAWKQWIIECGARVDLYRRYERGDHRAVISSQMRKMLRLEVDSSGLTDFNDNYCGIVVDKMASRIRVNGVTLRNDELDKNWLSPLLDYNNWDALQGTLFRGAIRDGDAYAMIDPETLSWKSEPAYDGYTGVFALFDGNGATPYWACKLWSESSSDNNEEDTICLVVYEADRVSFWKGENGGSELRPDNHIAFEEVTSQLKLMNKEVVNSDGENNPAPDSLVNYRPWPISMLPIVHFVNKYDNYSDNGESELRPAIPLQDVLNRTLHSMVMASEFSAFSIIWSIGMEIDMAGIVPGGVVNLFLKDPVTGQPIAEPTEAMAQFLSSVRVGQFQGTDIGQYTAQIDKLVREISQATQTPIYGITNQGAVSGEALKQLEIGLIGKCERFQVQNTDAVRDLIRISAEMQATLDTGYLVGNPPSEVKSIGVSWKSPEILDQSKQIDALVKLRKDAPGLWDDDFYRARIGALLALTKSEIEAETAKAKTTQTNNLLLLTGGAGNTPPA